MSPVVGSGPSGIACANALLDGGLPVSLVVVGIELECDKWEVLAPLRRQPSSEWGPEGLGQASLTHEGSLVW